ncbi:MAG TPA: hypothetical protein VIL29_13215 [Pseudothermotoga sp.]
MGKVSIGAALVAIFLIIVGLVLIFNLNANYIWSVILIVLGIGFEVGAFGKHAGRFIPGGILTTIGVLLLFCTIKGFSHMAYLWPVFVMAPAIGMIQTYFANHSKGILIASTILFGISVALFGISLYQWTFVRIVFGILVIAFGVLIFATAKKK